MIKLKKSVLTLVFLLSAAFVFAGCGNKTDMQENTTSTETTEQMQDEGSSVDTPADTDESGVGASTEDIRSQEDNMGDTSDDMGDAAKDAADDVGDAAKDVVDDVGKAADDVADGVGDAIDNLGGGSFDTYDDAKNYLLEKLKKDNAGANYEVREETKDLKAYNNNDSGAEGYQFSVYETDGNEKIGIYYVDKDTGKIYRYMGKNSIEAY